MNIDFDLKARLWDSDPVKIARSQAVAEGIKNSIPISSQLNALEYGCGTGLLSFALQPFLGHITLADSSTGMLSVLNEKITNNKIQNMISTKLDLVVDPLPANKYHLIYTLMTLHHIIDMDSILIKFYKILEDKGFLCIADLDKEDGSFHGPEFPGHKGFNRDDLEKKVKKIGFQKVTFTTIFQMPRGEGEDKKIFPIFLMISEK